MAINWRLFYLFLMCCLLVAANFMGIWRYVFPVSTGVIYTLLLVIFISIMFWLAPSEVRRLNAMQCAFLALWTFNLLKGLALQNVLFLVFGYSVKFSAPIFFIGALKKLIKSELCVGRDSIVRLYFIALISPLLLYAVLQSQSGFTKINVSCGFLLFLIAAPRSFAVSYKIRFLAVVIIALFAVLGSSRTFLFSVVCATPFILFSIGLGRTLVIALSAAFFLGFIVVQDLDSLAIFVSRSLEGFESVSQVLGGIKLSTFADGVLSSFDYKVLEVIYLYEHMKQEPLSFLAGWGSGGLYYLPEQFVNGVLYGDLSHNVHFSLGEIFLQWGLLGLVLWLWLLVAIWRVLFRIGHRQTYYAVSGFMTFSVVQSLDGANLFYNFGFFTNVFFVVCFCRASGACAGVEASAVKENGTGMATLR